MPPPDPLDTVHHLKEEIDRLTEEQIELLRRSKITFDRSLHRTEHLDQIERMLERATVGAAGTRTA